MKSRRAQSQPMDFEEAQTLNIEAEEGLGSVHQRDTDRGPGGGAKREGVCFQSAHSLQFTVSQQKGLCGSLSKRGCIQSASGRRA